MNKNKNFTKIIQILLIINLILLAIGLFSKMNFVLSPITTILNAMFIPIVLASSETREKVSSKQEIIKWNSYSPFNTIDNCINCIYAYIFFIDNSYSR